MPSATAAAAQTRRKRILSPSRLIGLPLRGAPPARSRCSGLPVNNPDLFWFLANHSILSLAPSLRWGGGALFLAHGLQVSPGLRGAAGSLPPRSDTAANLPEYAGRSPWCHVRAESEPSKKGLHQFRSNCMVWSLSRSAQSWRRAHLRDQPRARRASRGDRAAPRGSGAG